MKVYRLAYNIKVLILAIVSGLVRWAIQSRGFNFRSDLRNSFSWVPFSRVLVVILDIVQLSKLASIDGHVQGSFLCTIKLLSLDSQIFKIVLTVSNLEVVMQFENIHFIVDELE